jgi:hypothetical protein
MTTNSTANAVQIAQFTKPASVRHRSPTSVSSATITGMTSSAAISIGTSKARSARLARSLILVLFDGEADAPTARGSHAVSTA